jgi:hypothetical protein
VEAVREFVVMTNAYSAEFGRSSGGVLNAVTRSGTNEFHGSLFHFHRNSAMDAKNFFDPAARKIPAFKRNQFGGVLGGPIRREKTFFFGAFESLIERLGVAGLTNVPDADARRGILPGRPQFQVHPLMPQYLSTFFPMPNGRNLGGGLAEYQFNNSQPTNEYFAQGRVDHRISDKDSLFGRFTFSNGNVVRQMTAKPPVNVTEERSRNQYLTIEEQHIFTPALLNTLRLSYARSVSEADNVRTVSIPRELNWIPQEPFGYFTITGMVTEAAGDFRLPRNDYLNNYQWHNTMFWTKGAHGIRFGGEGQRMQFNQNTTSQRGGIVTFNGLENFLRGVPLSADFAVPGKIDPVRGYRQSLFGFFLQDDYRAKPNLTINLGVRYEFITVPTEVNGKISNLRTVTDSALTIGSPWHTNPSLKNFSPRVGMAWDPFKSGKTSVRAGFGIFYDQILPRYYFFSGSLNPPFTTRTTIANPTFPNILQNFDANAPIRAQLQTVNFDLQPAYALQFNASVQRSITKDLDVTIGYAGSRGVHLFRIADANLAPDILVNGVKTYQPSLGRRNPNFTTITQRISDAQSFYNALQITAVKRMTGGLRAQVSYTFSRAVDDSSGINSQDFDSSATYSMDFYDRKADRGLSSFWAKHVMVANWSYEMPFFQNSSGLKKTLLAGWQLNSIATAQTGHPFEVRLGFNRSGNLNTTAFSFRERPDAVAGCEQVNGGPDRYWNINCFTLPAVNTRGNLGRNTLIGPSLVMLDASMFKEFRFSESRHLQFRAEIFNLPNRPNFQIPPSANRTAFTAVTRDAQGRETPTIPGSWGRITSTVTTSRQIQLGLKLTF